MPWPFQKFDLSVHLERSESEYIFFYFSFREAFSHRISESQPLPPSHLLGFVRYLNLHQIVTTVSTHIQKRWPSRRKLLVVSRFLLSLALVGSACVIHTNSKFTFASTGQKDTCTGHFCSDSCHQDQEDPSMKGFIFPAFFSPFTET